jgi:hypothetical protein
MKLSIIVILLCAAGVYFVASAQAETVVGAALTKRTAVLQSI